LVRVPERVPGAAVVPLVDAVTTGAATVTLGSQEPANAEATSGKLRADNISKKVPIAFDAHGNDELLLAELMPTALEPISADPPESPGTRQIFATIELT
jgi:hypothetical protein